MTLLYNSNIQANIMNVHTTCILNVFLTISNIILDSMMDGKLKPLSLIDIVIGIIL